MAEAYEKIKHQQNREWYRLALDHGRKFASWFEVKQGTPQYNSWLEYFGRLGWIPVALKEIERSKEKSWTAPCEWPSSLGR